MSRRTMLFCAFAVAAAALFVRLGLWQVARLHERQARNAGIEARQGAAPAPFAALPRDSTAQYRAASVEGRFDYDHELILSSRTREGAPGVELLTPVRVAGTDTAVLVNRGWVYSPNGGTVDRTRWREGDSARVSGYVALYAADAGATRSTTDPRIVRRVSRQEIAAKIPYPVAPFYVVARSDTASTSHPVRRDMPALDNGPHASYAVQWFSFALIALGGAAVVVRRERHGTDER
jgi:surfeit locus 1 family protein